MGSKTAEITNPTFNLPALLKRVALGEEITLTQDGIPVARLVSVSGPKKERVPGSAKGLFIVGDDFDDPLPDDLQRAFEGEDDE